MKRPRKENGFYVISGQKFEKLIGSRAQVWHGTAFKTSGGLTKNKLKMNKNGRIVSKKKHETAKKEKRLEKAGYKTRKGVFGAVKKGKLVKSKKRKTKGKKTRKRRSKKN